MIKKTLLKGTVHEVNGPSGNRLEGPHRVPYSCRWQGQDNYYELGQ